MGGVYRNSAGEERYVHDDEIETAVQSGWSPRDATTFTAPTGDTRTLDPGQIQSAFGESRVSPTLAYTPEDELQQVLHDRLLQEQHGGTGDQILAGVEGAASAATFSLSDWILEGAGAATAERAEANPGARVVGEIGGALATIMTPGGVSKLTSAGAKLLGGGLKGRMAAEALEGMAFGVAQGSSNIALSNIPLSGEAVAEELITNGLYGTGFGAFGGALGHGAGKFVDKLKAGRTAREAAETAAKGVDDLPIAGISLEDGTAAVQKFVDGSNAVEKAAMNAAESAQLPFNGRDMIYSYRMSRQLMEEAGITPDGGFGSMLVDPKAIGPELRAVKKARRELGKLFGDNDLFDRAGLADAGGLKLVSNTPEKWGEAAKHLDDMREAAASINKKAGLGGRTGAATFDDTTGRVTMQGEEATDALLANDPHIRIKQVATGGRKISKRAIAFENGAEDIAAGMKEVNTASDAMNKAWGLSGKKPLSDMAVTAFLKMKPDKALVAAESYGQWVKALEGFASKFDDGAAKTAAAEARQSIKDAIGLVAKNPEFSNLSGAEMLANLAGKAEVPPITQDADDLLKVWLMDRMSRQAAEVGDVIPKGASKDKLGRWLQAGLSSAGSRAGSQAVRSFVPGAGGSGLLGKVLQGFGAATGSMTAYAVGGLISGGQHVAQTTGRHVGRIANATERLAKGLNRGSRAISPTATALLNKYPFGEEPAGKQQSKSLQELYKRRISQLSEMAANPPAAQQRIHDNLEPVRQINAVLADKLEMQAMADAEHFYETAPKDPGFMRRMGISVWKPSEDEIVRWASRFRALDAAGVWERVVGGRVTPQEAETLRKIRPETFTEIQRQISYSLPEIQKNCTFDQRNRMMLCFDVPTDPLNSKHTVTFIQNQFLERATGPDGEPVQFDGAGFKPEEPTDVQKMQGIA